MISKNEIHHKETNRMDKERTGRSLKEYQQLFNREILPMQREIYALVIKNIPVKQDAEDIYQQIFEKCWASLPRLRYSENIRQWVYQIARRTIADYYKQQLRREREIPFSEWNNGELSEDTEIMISNEDTRDLLDQILTEEDMRYCWHVFSQLDEKSRAVIWLWYDHGCFLNQVAEELDMNYNSVRSIFTRGIAKLRKLYQQNKREEFDEREQGRYCLNL